MNITSLNEPATNSTANTNIHWKNVMQLHIYQQKVDTFVVSLSLRHGFDDLNPKTHNLAIINCSWEAKTPTNQVVEP